MKKKMKMCVGIFLMVVAFTFAGLNAVDYANTGSNSSYIYIVLCLSLSGIIAGVLKGRA